MKYLIMAIMLVSLAGCTIQFKGKELELDAKPAEPGIKWSMDKVILDPVYYLKNGG